MTAMGSVRLIGNVIGKAQRFYSVSVARFAHPSQIQLFLSEPSDFLFSILKSKHNRL